MRIPINLASRKYEDVRRFYFVWSVALAALATVTLVLAGFAYARHVSTTQSAREARDLQIKITALQDERNQQRREDNLPENRDVNQQRQFWNAQILRRSLSWTLLFNELQRIMPRRAFLSSVKPDLTPENRLKLQLTIVGEKKDDALELIERMENSKHFQSTILRTEAPEKGKHPGEAPTYQFEIETFYTPSASANPASKEGV